MRLPQRVRRAGKICSALWLRITNRLKSPDCLLCMFTCTFIYVLCFIFILAIVVRTSNVGTKSGQSQARMQLTTVRGEKQAAAGGDTASGGSVLDSGRDVRGPGIGVVSGSDADAAGHGEGGAGDSDVIYERRNNDNILVQENAFNDSSDELLLAPLDPEVKTETSQLTGYGSQDFKHPLLVDMPDLLQRLRSGQPAPVRAVNQLEAPWLIGQAGRCTPKSPVYLVLLVKSHPANYANREAIRATWGRPDCWRRPVRVFFLLGADAAYGVRRGRWVLRRVRDWRVALRKENASRGDLLVREFVDHYYNNTLKLMSGVQWSVRQCRGARFTAFVDDDFFVNPYQVERQLDSISPAVYARFLGGWVWRTSLPRRRTRKNKSKWDISVSEYPWSTYPPYVAAGALFMSEPVIKDVSIAMEFTQYLRFDDIFIGLVAHKLLLTPLHMEMVRAYDSIQANTTDTATLMRLVASHGFKQPRDIASLWERLHLSGLCSKRESKP